MEKNDCLSPAFGWGKNCFFKDIFIKSFNFFSKKAGLNLAFEKEAIIDSKSSNWNLNRFSITS